MAVHNTKPKIVITSLRRLNYFNWFLVGFYKLWSAGKINFELRRPLVEKLFFTVSPRGINRIRRMLFRDDYNMDGYVIFEDGTKKNFTVDSADAPYLFDEERLKAVDAYFKMQCPANLNTECFELAEGINIPWSAHKHVDSSLKKLTDRGERLIIKNFSDYIPKIYPLMNGPRSLSRGIIFRLLSAGYENYVRSRNLHKTRRFMCYFGNAMGPKPEENVTHPDYDWERDIMGYFNGRISHPNEKRAKIAEYLSRFGQEADSRIISMSYADSGQNRNTSLVVSLNDFCRYISDFQYNFNVSGYRMSIPSRFIESFIVGTSIVTDKLAVKWYKPFDPCEVYETVKMGYERMERVDWAQFERDVMSLPNTCPQKIVDCFYDKWEPSVVAEYIINTLRQ